MAPNRVIGASPQESVSRAQGGPACDGVARRQVYLHAGQMFASAEPTSVVTILGSCVAVCLFDPVAKVGGINHYLLPLAVRRERSPRFGSVAVALLLDEVLGRGARRGNLRAKVFGGAGVLDGLRGNGRHLGHDNVDFALRALEAAAVPVVESDVGGKRGRKVIFQVDDGSAWVRTL